MSVRRSPGWAKTAAIVLVAALVVIWLGWLIVGYALYPRSPAVTVGARAEEVDGRPFSDSPKGKCFAVGSLWDRLATEAVVKIEDGIDVGIGGGTPKFVATLASGIKAVFKPHSSGLGR
jgi:hypothetical protein